MNVATIIDCHTGTHQHIPLVSGIGDKSVIKAISTSLPAVVVLYTPHTNIITNK